MLEEFGASNPDQFFAKYLLQGAQALGRRGPVFISIGSGNCDTEVRVASLLRNAGLAEFVIECLDVNLHMLERGREMAEREGVSANVAFIEGDFNSWRPLRRYAGVMANQSLHHVVNLEGLFDAIMQALDPGGFFVVSDMIGRNGHQRWPEALSEVHRFWRELPEDYRYNRLLSRFEDPYENWDCSSEGFEGIRAQDVLPELLKRFSFHTYIGFANVIDVFIDRAFGHNFSAAQEWDRTFIDRVHAADEQGLLSGTLAPTHMIAALMTEPVACRCSRGLSPERSVRKAD
jgi:SAM-dependent methyltransferase